VNYAKACAIRLHLEHRPVASESATGKDALQLPASPRNQPPSWKCAKRKRSAPKQSGTSLQKNFAWELFLLSRTGCEKSYTQIDPVCQESKSRETRAPNRLLILICSSYTGRGVNLALNGGFVD